MEQERRVTRRMGTVTEIDIDSVAVRKRVRRNLGDVTALAESLRKHGMLNPIVVDAENVLIAGHRRLEAARKLGWSRIPARVISQEDEAALVEMEIDENTQRKDLTSDELAEAYIRLDRLRNPGWIRKLFAAIKAFFSRIFGIFRHKRDSR
ncbi:MAG: ParB N-terminal domain-containing protein [Spirochaetaceae bacterium]